MSISLVLFRLEIADDCTQLIDINYNAPFADTLKVSYADVTKGCLSKIELLKHRGRRNFQQIDIETFVEKGESDKMAECSLVDNQDDGAIGGHSDMPGDSFGATCTKQLDTDTKLGSRAVSDSPDMDVDASRPGSGKSHKSMGAATPRHSSTIHFFSGNPSVEKTEGIIHLYKDSQMTSLREDVARSDLIGILSVPAVMASSDLLRFVAPVEPWIERLQIIRDSTPNQYMVLVKFRQQEYADDFYKTFNNQPFNSIEPDLCHLVYVAKVETVKESQGAGLPVQGMVELPVCPVCLERMDESVDGILTILCNHSFHGSCLAQWGDATCPVCRYVQTPEVVADNKCFCCRAQESLWICLICGHVGCGRYVEGCAYKHFEETNHTYSMQLDNNRVWDYAGDNYVHRLIQSKGDGKMVELDESRDGSPPDDEKLDSITLEYTYLLTNQLESQRHYFEEKMQCIEQEALKQVEAMSERSKQAFEEVSSLRQHLATVSKERHSLERKCQQLTAKIDRTVADLTDEKEMNSGLQQNQSQWQHKVVALESKMKQKDQMIADLQEQLRDVMFYLEAQQKLQQTTEVSQQEIQQGHIVVQPSASTATAKKGRKKAR